MKNTISQGFLLNPTGEGKVSWIDHRDIALVAKHILTEDTHHRATYFLTGPEALSTNDVARKFTKVLGFEVNSVPIAMEDMRNQLVHTGLDEWRIHSFMAQYDMVKGAYGVDVTEDVKRITGQNPRTLEQFIEEFKGEFSRGREVAVA
ncbi:hypothetical protein [Larkinella arboricola]|uniref:hypothetical protein n=1 Tax=Larkinella arboricola TaxID=643671 RepID=UPI000DBACA37|nr:hypothetical protein [Larkinella arboricola]